MAFIRVEPPCIFFVWSVNVVDFCALFGGFSFLLIARAVMTVKTEENHETSNLNDIPRRNSRRDTEQNKAKKAKLESYHKELSAVSFSLDILHLTSN